MLHPLRLSCCFVALAALAQREARGAEIVAGPPSLQNFINIALTNNDTVDTIFVLPGTYNEAVTIDFDGSNQEGLFITRAEQAKPLITGGIVIDDARLVTLGGLRVGSAGGDGQAAILVRDSTGVAVLECVVPAGDDGGLDAQNTYELIVDDCKFNGMETHGNADMGFGIRIRDLTCHQVLDTKASANQSRGIWIEADRTEVRRCTVTDNEGDAGVWLMGLQNTLRDCAVNENENAGVRAIGVCDVRSNDVLNNGSAGVRLGENGATQYLGGIVRKNKIKNSGGPGIVINADQDAVDVQGNSLSGNENAGVRLESDQNVVRSNSIRGTTAGGGGSGHGVHVVNGSDGNCVEGNTFKANSGDAVQVDGDNNYVVVNLSKDGDGYVNGAGTTNNDGRGNETTGENDFP